MKAFWKNISTHGKDSGEGSAVTWYGVSKFLFLRLGLSALLFFVGLFLPENALTVLLMLLSFLLCGYDVIIRGVVTLTKERTLGEELLITVAAVLAFTINAGYEAAAIMLLYQGAFVLRSYARELTSNSLRDRIDPYAPTVCVVQDGSVTEIPVEEIRVGDLLQVETGERFPVDCQVSEDEVRIDLYPILGSSSERMAVPGDVIPAGSINIGKGVRVRANGVAEDSVFAREISTASDEDMLHSSAQKDIERYAKLFGPFALGLTVLAALLLLIFTSATTERAIHRALMILIVACPTAFLAPLPLNYLAGFYRSLAHGVLVKGADSLDAISRTGAVIMDKDDMLATGQYRVLFVKSDRMDSRVLLKVAAHAGFDAQSPLIHSITSSYEGIIDHSLVEDFSEEEEGITAVIDGITITMGSLSFMEEKEIPANGSDEGELTVYMALNGRYAGCILLGDVILEESRRAVMALESTGADCVLLSNDGDERTRTAAAAAGIREYHAQCMPLDRLEKIQEVKERFPSNSVLYVGLGTSDTSSLSAADLGVCVNGLASEAAFQGGDIVIMDRTAEPLADAIDSGRLTQRSVRRTLLLVLAEKLILLLLSLFGVSYQLWFAMMVDMAAGIAGVLFSARIWEEKQF